jgi:periplasmic copper chaperone A
VIAGARRRRGAGLVLALMACGCTGSATPPATLMVRDARAFEARIGATAAAYATIVNGSDSADVVDSVTTLVARFASMHSQREQNGFVTMTPLDRPPIAARDSLVLTPGGDHLMLEGVDRELKAGDRVPLTFWFHRAGRIEVAAKVSAYGS